MALVLLIPIGTVVILLVSQEGTNVDVSHRLLPIALPGIVDNGNEPVTIVPNVEDDKIVNRIGIIEHFSDINKALPANVLDNFVPRRNLILRVWIFGRRFVQMFQRDHVHKSIIFAI
jgi:hypothetical protein